MHRRGLTLLELLIVIGLLVAVLAIAMPSFQSLLAKQSFESAAESLQHQLLLARAHAQATGQPVEVAWRAKSNRIESTLFPLNRDELLLTPKREDPFAETTPADPIRESWARVELPRGITLSATAPQAADDGVFTAQAVATRGPSLFAALEPDPLADSADEAPLDIRIAVLMPDGTAMLSTDVWLADADGRVGQFRINPWSGSARFEPFDPHAPLNDPDAETNEPDNEENIPEETDGAFTSRATDPLRGLSSESDSPSEARSGARRP